MGKLPNHPEQEVAPRLPSQAPVSTGVVDSAWQGPLPPPAILRDFDLIVTDGAVRIPKQFELEYTHRREQERRQMRIMASDVRIGQVLAGL